MVRKRKRPVPRTWFKEVIRERGFSQETLSYEVDLSPIFINLLVVGKRNPSRETARRIGEVLKIDPELFFSA